MTHARHLATYPLADTEKSDLHALHGKQWIVAGKMVPHDNIRITIPGRAMDKPHVITGARTRRQGTPHTMVLLATEPMAIASLSLTTVIRLSTPSLHLKATRPLASGLLTPEVITLRIDASTISRVMNRTVTTTVRHKTTKGNHKGVAPTSALRNTARDVPVITATIARNQIENILMAMVIIVHNPIRSVTEAEARASTKGQPTAIRSREDHIHVSRVGRRHFKNGVKRWKPPFARPMPKRSWSPSPNAHKPAGSLATIFPLDFLLHHVVGYSHYML